MCYGCSNCGACGKKIADAPATGLRCAECGTPVDPGVPACPACGCAKVRVGEMGKASGKTARDAIEGV